MVYASTTGSTDRAWQFENCHFDNFAPNWANLPLENVFASASENRQTTNFTLKNCTANGYQYWMNRNVSGGAALWIRGADPAVAVLGGITVDATGTS